MKPGSYMMLGAVIAVCAAGVMVAFPLSISPQTAGLLFAGGAVFGKGYGIWEERQRKVNKP